jgi:hypothetical protein
MCSYSALKEKQAKNKHFQSFFKYIFNCTRKTVLKIKPLKKIDVR